MRMKLEKLADKPEEKTPSEGTPLNILVVTWNLMGTMPSQRSLELLLSK